jgi:hypothetical protein
MIPTGARQVACKYDPIRANAPYEVQVVLKYYASAGDAPTP